MAEWATTSTTSGGNAVWHVWAGDYTSGATTNSSDVIWASWTSDDGTSGSITYALSQAASLRRYEPPQETEEQRQARLAREQQLENNREIARLQKEEARLKAEELLRESLDEEQREQFNRTKWFFVISQSGKRYRIRHGWAGNIDELNEKDEIVAGYCIHPATQVPIEDSMLIQKLMLEADEQHLLQIANKTIRSSPQPLVV